MRWWTVNSGTWWAEGELVVEGRTLGTWWKYGSAHVHVTSKVMQVWLNLCACDLKGNVSLAQPVCMWLQRWCTSFWLVCFFVSCLHLQTLSMPHCHCCSKKCKNDACLLLHMNHPASKCIKFFNELIQILEVLWHNKFKTRQQPRSKSIGFKDEGDIIMDGPDLPEVPTSDQPGEDDASSNSEEEAPPPQSKNYYTEAYPGAAWTYKGQFWWRQICHYARG